MSKEVYLCARLTRGDLVIVLCIKMTELRDDQRLGKILILGMSDRAFPEEINIGISRLRDLPS